MKAQLMAEDQDLNTIPGITSEDLEPGVYEGGFKTWECAEDLSSYLLRDANLMGELGEQATIIEVGALGKRFRL